MRATRVEVLQRRIGTRSGTRSKRRYLRGRETAADVLASLGAASVPDAETAQGLRDRIAALHESKGFVDYKSWMEKVGEPC